MIEQYLVIFIGIFFEVISFAILARIILSWFPGRNSGLRQFLVETTDPILLPFQKIVPRLGMIDISPIVALFVLDMVRGFVIALLRYIFGIL